MRAQAIQVGCHWGAHAARPTGHSPPTATPISSRISRWHGAAKAVVGSPRSCGATVPVTVAVQAPGSSTTAWERCVAHTRPAGSWPNPISPSVLARPARVSRSRQDVGGRSACTRRRADRRSASASGGGHALSARPWLWHQARSDDGATVQPASSIPISRTVGPSNAPYAANHRHTACCSVEMITRWTGEARRGGATTASRAAGARRKCGTRGGHPSWKNFV
jgi:hypothetical protein